jgi:lipoprotein-anchoring transpeptidase ErfK/SrfK
LNNKLEGAVKMDQKRKRAGVARRAGAICAILGIAPSLTACGGGSYHYDRMTPPAHVQGAQSHNYGSPLAANSQPTLSMQITQAVGMGIPNPERMRYSGGEVPGTIILNTYTRSLYLIESTSTAIYYPIAVGSSQGMELTESCYKVSRKTEWPSWTPTPSMHERYPGRYPTTVPGGPENPMGAAALYLVRCSNGQDDYLRIHGTNQPQSIGRAASSGCIRMHNDHVSDLFNRAHAGATIRVHRTTQTPSLHHPGTRALMGYAHG